MPTLLGNIYALKLQQERNVPFGMFVTARQADIHSETRAMGQSPAGRPLFFGPNFKDKEFVDVATFTYALKIVYEKFFERWAVLGWIDQKFQAFVGSLDLIKENIYSQQFIFKNAIFSIRDLPQSLFFPFTSAGDVINAGGHCKDVSNAQMSTNLKTIYDDGNINTIVYLAFGGSVRFFDAPPNVIASFLDLFEAFPTITFIWSYKGPPIVNLPGNAHLFEWVNQDAILSHEKTKLFISHSGLKSIKEGLCSEKAMLFMPVFAEQVHNAISANILWGAPFVNKFYVSGTELIRKVNGTLGNDVYGDKIKKTKAMMIDTIMDPLKESVWQVKKFLSEKRKVKFSKRKGMDVSWIEQFYGIEFGIFISIVVILAK
uniref:Glucuronosyltransferase n=1 Tax=Rhabditophanes sp. KR3021 TaxID=114890 RepID=A0AC35TGN4_9BILA